MGFLDFSPATIIAAFVFSVFGWFIFRRGKADASMKRIFVGVALMGYGYFVSNPWACWAVGIALTVAGYSSWSD